MKILTFFQHKLLCLLFSGSLLLSVAHAAPEEEDALNQLIQQQQRTHQKDTDGLEALIDRKIQEHESSSASRSSSQHNQSNAPPNSHAARQSTNIASSSNTPIAKKDADELLSSAMGFLGVAYRFGGTSPTGFDCSGFMQYIFRKTFAVNLPRTSAEQAQMGVQVNRADLQPGDMVFFRTSGNRISHVGMYVGNNRFIHAPRTGKNIEITSLSHQYWNSRYVTARRVKRHNAQQFIK
ncbi:MAG: C40 family peptidase [Alysiella sp.]|uniref:C40 family peptidase n=1 Tax=Alysiella sp. TaxID=1872483 RepID=UPI0026DCD9B6|nr:C40 family peptidase [Alysiella sp.]MDO4433714.1 C40 family peptidase [Alysiella sp.]